jgi:hypothetical protein
VNGVVVDITADQFGEPAVIVSAESPWHRSRVVQERIAFDECRVELLRSAPLAEYTRQVSGRVTEIVDGHLPQGRPPRVMTLQAYDLRQFAGPIDLSQGTYREHDEIIAAQRRLYVRLGCDQIVWTSFQPPDLFPRDKGKFVHEVDADWRDVAAVVDGLIWNHIIGTDPRYIPPEEHSKLRFRAGQMAGGDEDKALRAVEDEYLRQRLPENLWDGLCRSSIEFPSDQVLLRFPFKHSVIVAVHEVTAEVANGSRFRVAKSTSPRQVQPSRPTPSP